MSNLSTGEPPASSRACACRRCGARCGRCCRRCRGRSLAVPRREPRRFARGRCARRSAAARSRVCSASSTSRRPEETKSWARLRESRANGGSPVLQWTRTDARDAYKITELRLVNCLQCVSDQAVLIGKEQNRIEEIILNQLKPDSDVQKNENKSDVNIWLSAGHTSYI